MSSIYFTPQAQKDLETIYQWVFQDKARAAGQLLDRMEETVALLAENPEMGRARSELSDGLRSFSIESYVIFYRTSKRGLEILRILNGAQDIFQIF